MPSSPHKRSSFRPHPPRRSYRLYIYLTLALALLYVWHSPPSLFHSAPIHSPSLIYKNVDWSLFAYSTYATDTAYLCNAVMLFEALHRLGSKADRILFYPSTWDLEVSDSHDRDSQLLVKAQEDYGVKLVPTQVFRSQDETWNASFTKLLAWDQTQYDRVLHLDTDITLFKHMDELFLLPPAEAVMSRAYGHPEHRSLSSKLILIEPAHAEFERLLALARAAQKDGKTFDLDTLDGEYDDTALVLPHTIYGLRSSEFRTEDHTRFLGKTGLWDPDRVMSAASLVRFEDQPFPKPWVMWPRLLLAEKVPQCKRLEYDREDCRDKKIWLGLYDDFRQRRKEICGLLSVPAPEWSPKGTVNATETP